MGLQALGKMVATYGDDLAKALKKGADKADDVAIVVQKRGAFNCFGPTEYRYAESLEHRISDISATIRPDSSIGNLAHKSESVARITREQFEAMQKANIIKTGTGKNSVIFDEFTGTSYYLAENGMPMMESATTRGNISQDLWKKISGLFG